MSWFFQAVIEIILYHFFQAVPSDVPMFHDLIMGIYGDVRAAGRDPVALWPEALRRSTADIPEIWGSGGCRAVRCQLVHRQRRCARHRFQKGVWRVSHVLDG
jgi:hypothetical protein